jgi:hypothetical protein
MLILMSISLRHVQLPTKALWFGCFNRQPRGTAASRLAAPPSFRELQTHARLRGQPEDPAHHTWQRDGR